MSDVSVWNELSRYFNVHSDTIDPGAADNILMAWPPIVKFLGERVPKGGRVLEYGCGTGGFAKKLVSLGYSVVGMDPAVKMIALAKQHVQGVPFLVGTVDDLDENEKFSAATAIMVFQFVEDIDRTFLALSSRLTSNGCIVFAVFDPAFVLKCVQKGVLFRDFETASCTGRGTMDFGEGRETDVYIRTVEEYDRAMKRINLKKFLEVRPPFTKEFLEKYPTNSPTDVAEFLILGYQKN